MQAAAEYCVENAVTMLSVSSSFRDRPFELATTGSVSESALPPHGTERQRILNSFRPQDRGRSGPGTLRNADAVVLQRHAFKL